MPSRDVIFLFSTMDIDLEFSGLSILNPSTHGILCGYTHRCVVFFILLWSPKKSREWIQAIHLWDYMAKCKHDFLPAIKIICIENPIIQHLSSLFGDASVGGIINIKEDTVLSLY